VATEVFSDGVAAGRIPGFTGATITEPELLKVELARIRSRGYALDEEEFVEGICCVAAPVFGEAGRLVAALGVSVPTFRFRAERERLIQAVTDVARVTSVPSGVTTTIRHKAAEEAI
jgi:IclR family acetate operon transcriptional repressor